MVAIVWLIGLMSCLILIGSILRGRQDQESTRRLYGEVDRLVPNHRDLFQQRQRKRHLIFKRVSRLD